MSHDAFSQYDGAYVLGALSPADRQAFEDHLTGCDTCRRAVSEIAGLPGLLSRLGPDQLDPEGSDPGAGPVPDTLLPRLVAEVRRTQRRRRTWVGLAAAAAVITVTSVGVGVAQQGSTPPEAGAPTRVMAQVHQAQLSARLAMQDVAWGTRLSITCTYSGEPYPGVELPSYALVVHTRDGRTEKVATWRAVAGKPITVVAATASRRSEITSVEVRTTRGEPALRLQT